VGEIMARVLECEPGMEIYDPCCGSGGLLVKCESALDDRMRAAGNTQYAPLQLYGQEYVAETWAMANMNMIIHDIGPIEIGDTFKNPKFRERGRLKTFDRVVANPMWNQDWFTEADYANDELDRFPTGAGFPGKASAVVVGACPASNAGGSGFPLQVLGRITGLRAFRSNPSREMRDLVSTTRFCADL
jgi:type I restriction enzyme M protein